MKTSSVALFVGTVFLILMFLGSIFLIVIIIPPEICLSPLYQLSLRGFEHTCSKLWQSQPIIRSTKNVIVLADNHILTFSKRYLVASQATFCDSFGTSGAPSPTVLNQRLIELKKRFVELAQIIASVDDEILDDNVELGTVRERVARLAQEDRCLI